ncbi:MAG: outer membrane protein assembly factor BamC [Sulfurimicrobium sp.]|nr:outer membrane protein assembly factor BamC [Sulfurimicrobium sp.]MDO9190975.1 outer membrane protein assembly factor BamC [Sulfurimicrobium sp.]MDP1704134.1 outer membrane protein assembly factor BamC [Sulfurimicrobium sp.]MDP2199539.1 outer membrane protein assembly factor BamC [Sulfurimicrobium sp.]MDZ7654637.1 outer membrane protein assembly factor BamC [Sulfurimicrobium sp.]
MMFRKLVLPITLLALLAGCSSSFLEGRKIDYKSAGKVPSLEVPPDLTAPSTDSKFVVPDVNPQGSATFSTYNRERAAQPQSGGTNLLPDQPKVSVERAGSQRWLVVRATPEQVWPVVKEFWQELGFIIKTEAPESGVMETDWAEDRAKIPQDMIRSALGKVLDGLYSTAERDKFRTRLERGKDAATTEVYISHRGMYEVLEGGSGNRTIWQPRPSDPEMEAEMLRRLMVRFGVEEARAKTQIATVPVEERARINRGQDGSQSLLVLDPFDRAWRRVGLALDRVGFTVVDRDRSKGLYFVRYVDPDADSKKEEKGLLSKLAFWNSSDSKAMGKEQYRIQVTENAENSQVQVLNKDGKAENSDTAAKILKLLHAQLK